MLYNGSNCRTSTMKWALLFEYLRDRLTKFPRILSVSMQKLTKFLLGSRRRVFRILFTKPVFGMLCGVPSGISLRKVFAKFRQLVPYSYPFHMCILYKAVVAFFSNSKARYMANILFFIWKFGREDWKRRSKRLSRL